MKHTAVLALALLATPFAAMAGGPAAPTIEPTVAAPVPVAPPPQAVDWTGYYTGLSLGHGKSYANVSGQDGTLGIGGVNLGYRKDLGQVVIGGELSYDKDNFRTSGNSNSAFKNTTALKMIVGTNLGRTLVYGTVGLAQSDATVAGTSGSDHGYTAGIGADYALNQQWTVGGELSTDRYNNFDNTGIDLKNTAVKVKIGYRF